MCSFTNGIDFVWAFFLQNTVFLKKNVTLHFTKYMIGPRAVHLRLMQNGIEHELWLKTVPLLCP